MLSSSSVKMGENLLNKFKGFDEEGFGGNGRENVGGWGTDEEVGSGPHP